MTSGFEWCRQQTCPSSIDHAGWREEVHYAIISPSSFGALENLEQHIFESLTAINNATGVQFIAHIDNRDPQLFFVVLDETSIEAIRNGIIPTSDEEYFEQVTMGIYEAGGCSAQVFLSTSDEYTNIDAAIIYVNGRLIGQSLRQCVWEEIYNSAGLFNDPIGQESLFDGENFSYDGQNFNYSDQSTLMLEALYQIRQGHFADMEDFLESGCGSSF